MKVRVTISLLLGAVLPFSYFLFVQIGSTRFIDESSATTTFGESGQRGFVQFHGILDSLLIYLATFLVCTAVIYLIVPFFVRDRANE